MSIGFKSPRKKEVRRLMRELKYIKKPKHEYNVKKVFEYCGEEKARKLAKKLGVEIDIFDFSKIRSL